MLLDDELVDFLENSNKSDNIIILSINGYQIQRF